MCGDMPVFGTPMPGETWAGTAASFTFMWTAMMVPMMMPSLAPALRRYRAPSAAVAAAGYFFVWALLGLAVYPLGVLFAGAGTQLAAGAAVVAAGLVQFSAWKRKHLACCREVAQCCAAAPVDASSSWLHGMHLGMRCALCCGNLMAALVVIGMMNLAAMVTVAAAITLERLAPARLRVERWIGAATVGFGLVLLAR